jgi:glucan phosphoethanolaminetransferase (alkaline phosphatase superfamily)
MGIFLKLKHWHLFLLTVGILIIIFTYSRVSYRADEEDEFVFDAIARFITIIPFLVYFLWLWSVGTILNDNNKVHLKIRPAYFYVSVAVSYFIFFFFTVFNMLEWGQMKDDTDNMFATYVLMAIPLILGIFAWLFALNFVAKTLVRAERELHVNPADYFGEYIMILLFPIGIWIIQPRINDLLLRSGKDSIS